MERPTNKLKKKKETEMEKKYKTDGRLSHEAEYKDVSSFLLLYIFDIW